MAKLNFLQTLESHDPSEIIIICWVCAQETFHIIINVETVVLCHLKKKFWLKTDFLIKKFE